MTMVKRFVAAALFAGVAFAANADTAWMVLPRYSKSGRTLLHGCRSNCSCGMAAVMARPSVSANSI